MSKKPVIVFEGIEGSGKSFHISNISKYLKKNKVDFIKIREPGGSLNAEIIRKIILNNNSSFTRETDLLLYLAARSENINLLNKHFRKKIILIDRFIDSTIAYQHYGLGINLNLINTLNRFLLKKFKVDFTFLNIVNKKNMIKRLKLRKSLNRYDKFDSSFYQRVQKGFIKLAKSNPKKYQIIDSNLDISINKYLISQKIKKII
tara:strand:- start:5 stop:616 length:612 start_codon:yes stop_codon:yes gene_type:complete